MKIKLFFVLVLFVLMFSHYSSGQDSTTLMTPEEFGEQIFKAFKTNDFILLESFLISKSTHAQIIENSNLSDSLKSAYLIEDAGAINVIRRQAQPNFNKIRKSAETQNIVWETAELVEVIYFTEVEDGIESADFGVIIKSGDVIFALDLSNCRKSDTWNIMNDVRLQVKGQ